MVNTDSIAIATFPIADGMPVYAGDTAIAGVPGTAATIRLDFADIAGWIVRRAAPDRSRRRHDRRASR